MSSFLRTTEQPSHYRHLEKMSIGEIIQHINNEDKKVAFAVEKSLPQIEALIAAAADKNACRRKAFLYWRGNKRQAGNFRRKRMPAHLWRALWIGAGHYCRR